MPQKSRNVAARYAAQSKDRKTKRRAAVATEPAPRPVQAAEIPIAQPVSPAKVPTPVAPAQRIPKYRSTTQIIASNYSYVSEDLRQILIVSGVLLAIIVALAFVLH